MKYFSTKQVLWLIVLFPLSIHAQVPAFTCLSPPTLNPKDPNFLTGDIASLVVNQREVDCYAWQLFVALNWPVDSRWPAQPEFAGEPDRNASPSTWGLPQDPDQLRPAVWETYKPSQEIFLPNARTPKPWGEFEPPPSHMALTDIPDLFGFKSMTSSKFESGFSAINVDILIPDLTMEAKGGWLTDQNKQLVWFERLVNRAEFEYIFKYKLYDADIQVDVATNKDGKHPHGLSLPTGQPLSGTTIQTWDQRGAIEIKAAWRILTKLPKLWPRYRLSKTIVHDPNTGTTSKEVLGLIGWHIMHKTKSFPNFMWATFEHIDNVPTPNTPYTHPFGYSFTDTTCTNCTPNVARVDSNGKPLFPKDQPVQVERENPIDSTSDKVVQLNLAMQQMIRDSTNGKSVYQYYQLVNVLWPPSPAGPYTKPNGTVPLKVSSMTSAGPNTPVANPVLETYVQNTNCTDCHKSAAIAGQESKPYKQRLASDFSFLFQTAQKSTTSK